jgi:uncharacterized membrane protein YqjE
MIRNAETRTNSDRPLRDIIQELKTEASGFVNTRIAMLKAEINEKIAHLKAAAPMLAAAILFALGAFFAFTYALIAVIAVFVNNQYAWAIGAGAVFLLYAIIGGLLGWLGIKEVKTEGLAPQRTIRVLKQDQDWLKNEARTA